MDMFLFEVLKVDDREDQFHRSDGARLMEPLAARLDRIADVAGEALLVMGADTDPRWWRKYMPFHD